MKSLHTYSTSAAIVLLLTIFYDVNCQLTPTERCTAKGAGTSVICLDCFSYDTCTDMVLKNSSTACGVGQVCDHTIADGFCITPTTSAISPICFCQSTGCQSDPNDPSLYVQCTATEEAATAPPTCVYPTEFNINTCICDTVTCPPCGFYPADNSDCSTDYYYCQTEIITTPFTCLPGLCFNTTTCSCQGVTVACPTCGAYPDPGSTDGMGFCICGDAFPTDICTNCPGGTLFNAATCGCSVSLSTTSIITTILDTTTNIPETTVPLTTAAVSEAITSVSETIPTVSKISTTVHQSTTTVPQSTTTVPQSTTTVPQSTTTVPQKTTTVPQTTTSPQSTTTVPLTTTTILTTVTCLTCGLGDDPGADCSKYYSCTADGVITGTFFCPGNECFNTNLCGCI